MEHPIAPAVPEYTVAKVAELIYAALPTLVILSVCHALVVVFMRKLNGDKKMAQQVAYNLVILVFDIISCSIGLHAWLDGTMANLGTTTHERLYGYSSAFATLCALTAAFEVYNTIVSAVVVPQGAALIGHHVVTLSLCGIGVAPYVHYYGLFFFGIANLSSIPLAAFSLCDALRSRYPAFEASYRHLRTAFGVLFLIVRVAIWPMLSARFWMDTYAAARSNRVHSYPATLLLMGANIFLTGLQFAWARKVLKGLLKVMSTESEPPSNRGKPKAADAMPGTLHSRSGSSTSVITPTAQSIGATLGAATVASETADFVKARARRTSRETAA